MGTHHNQSDTIEMIGVHIFATEIPTQKWLWRSLGENGNKKFSLSLTRHE